MQSWFRIMIGIVYRCAMGNAVHGYLYDAHRNIININPFEFSRNSPELTLELKPF